MCDKDLRRASACINAIMFSDDNNLFYPTKNVKTLFETMNFQLIKISY